MGCGCHRLKRVAQGAAKVMKSTVGIGLTKTTTIKRRRAICRTCEHAVPCQTNPQRYCTCAHCGCWLKHKTRLAAERCPEGKW